MVAQRGLVTVMFATIGLVCVSCDQGPKSVRVAPAIDDPQEISRHAIATYDRNHDGYLAGDELKACPGLAWGSNKFDADKDSRVSAEEIANRVDDWLNEGAGLLSFACRVTLNGRALKAAQVLLVPEKCLGPGAKQAKGVADSDGVAQIAIASEDLPIDSQNRRVVQPGIYKVLITHPQVPVPARYNTDTILGCEVAFDCNRDGLPEFQLSSN